MLKRFEIWTNNLPQNLSVAVATTASLCKGRFDDDTMYRSIPEIPPVSKQVKSRSEADKECDQCSPLATLKLDLYLDSYMTLYAYILIIRFNL